MNSERRALLVLMSAATLSLIWLVDPYFQSMWDAVLYLLTTRSLLAGEGYAVYGEAFSLRPPGFSMMLAPVIALFGENYLVLNIFVSLIGVVALGLMFLYFRPRLGIALSLALCVTVWINPQYQRMCNAALSDTAGLAAVLFCLLLERRARKSESARSDVWLGIAIAAAMYLRTVSFLLIPVIAFGRLVNRNTSAGSQPLRAKFLRLGLLVLIPVLLQLPWNLWVKANPPPEPLDQYGIYSYSVAQWQVDPADPNSDRVPISDIAARIHPQSERCFTSIGLRVPNRPPPEERGRRRSPPLSSGGRRDRGFVFGCLGVIALIVVGIRRRDPGSLFALGNLAILLLYFDFGARILFPVYIFVLGAVLELLQLGLGKLVATGRASGLLAILALTMGIMDATPTNQRNYVAARNRVHADVADYVNRHYPEDVRVAGSFGHNLAAFFERPIYYVEIAASKRGKSGVVDVLQRREIDVFIDTGIENANQRAVLDPVINGRMQLVHQIEGVKIYELNHYAEL